MDHITISISEFRRDSAQLLATVVQRATEIIITKHGRPMVKVVKYLPKPNSLIGMAKDDIEITGDIVAPVSDVEWGTEPDFAGETLDLERRNEDEG